MSDFQVVADNRRAFEYVNARIGINYVQNMTGICLLREGEVIAAVVYQDFNGSNIILHIAAEPGRKWMNRAFLYWCFHYPFVQLHANRLTVWVNSDNLTSLAFVKRLGWRDEATLVGAGPQGQDVQLLVMRRENCKYVEEGQQFYPVRSADRASSGSDIRRVG